MEINFEHFLNMIRNRQEPTVPKLTTIQLEKCPSLKNDYDKLSIELKNLFRILFCSQPQK
jgi:hypothetical protein